MIGRVTAVVLLTFALASAHASLAWQQTGAAPPPSTPPAPQQPATPQQPTFRTRIDAVSVDVSVTDKQGRPVTDLTASDFEVREANKPQTIDTFKLIEVDDATAPAAPVREIHSMEDQERETARDDVRIIVVFLDDYHVRRGNSMRVREQLARFVSTLGPRDLVATMYPLTPTAALTFSVNHDATSRDVMGFWGRKYDYSPKSAAEQQLAGAPAELQEQMRNQVTMSALESLCTYLGSLNDARKTVLFVSEGLVGTLPQGVNTIGTMPQPGVTTPQNQTIAGAQDRMAFFNQVQLLEQFQFVFAAAARANTAIYTLDPRGLAAGEFEIDDNVGSDVDRRTLSEATDNLRTIAGETEGRAIVNRNDALPGLRQMLRDSSAYYLLGYTSTEAPRDGKFHEIQVRVKRKDVDVRARKGYWAYSPEDIEKITNAGKKTGPPPEVEDALAALSDAPRGRPVNIWLGADRGANGKAEVTLAWEAATSSGPSTPEDAVDHVTVTANSVYGDLLFKGPVPRDAHAVQPAGRVTFEAPPGSAHVQIVAENAKGQRLGRDDRDVDVPDFTKVGPLVTLPVVFRARTARDVQQIRASAAPVPTATREFSRTERLLLRFQAYGPAGSSPAVTLRLLNQLGAAMATLPAPTRLPDGTYEEEVGLGGLAPADYLIEIAAAAETGQTRTLLAIRVTG